MMRSFHSTLIVATSALVVCGSFLFQQSGSTAAEYDRFKRVTQALEAYAADNNGRYPPHYEAVSNQAYCLPILLSTPIAYLQKSEMIDPVAVEAGAAGPLGMERIRYVNFSFAYAGNPTLYNQYRNRYGEWLIWSPGHDRVSGSMSGTPWSNPIVYDATNGVFSGGDFYRTQKMTQEAALGL